MQMSLISYNELLNTLVLDDKVRSFIEDAEHVIAAHTDLLYFIGNGGSQTVASHFSQDFGKILGIKAFVFSDPSLITAYTNDYGQDMAMFEWLKLYSTFGEDRTLVAVSSSGESPNVINAAAFAKESGFNVVTLSGFKSGNTLSTLGDLNLHVDSMSYGECETMHGLVLHSILDDLVALVEEHQPVMDEF